MSSFAKASEDTCTHCSTASCVAGEEAAGSRQDGPVGANLMQQRRSVAPAGLNHCARKETV